MLGNLRLPPLPNTFLNVFGGEKKNSQRKNFKFPSRDYGRIHFGESNIANIWSCWVDFPSIVPVWVGSIVTPVQLMEVILDLRNSIVSTGWVWKPAASPSITH